MSTAPVPPPPRKSNLLWWLLGIAGAAIALAIACGLILSSLVVKSVRVEEKNKRVEIRTPAGNLTVTATDKVRDVGLPVYPSAALADSGGSVALTTPQDESVGASALHYRSSDSIDKIDAWYSARLGPEFKREGPHVRKGRIAVVGVEVNSDSIVFES